MTNPSSTTEPTSAPNPAVPRTGRAWVAHTHQALIAPAHTLIELAGLMLADARERGQEEFRADLEKIHTSGRTLLALFHDLLDPTHQAGAEIDTLRMLRHELRTPLTHVIGYCELWLADAETFFLDSFLGDLQELHDLGKQMLARLDEIVRLFERTGDATNPPSPPVLRGRGEEETTPPCKRGIAPTSAARPALCWSWTTTRSTATSSAGYSAETDTLSPAPPTPGRPRP